MNSVDSFERDLLLLGSDRGLQRESAQLQAKAAFTRILGEPPDIGWRYVAARVVRNAMAALVDLRHLSLRDGDLGEEELRIAHEFARLWESLADLEERTGRGVALLNAAFTYEVAGYQANAACLARLYEREGDRVEPGSFRALASRFLQRKFVDVLNRSLDTDLHIESLSREDETWETANRLARVAFGRASAYFLSGEQAALDRSFQLLSESLRGFSALGRVEDSNLISSVRSLLPVMDRRSTWRILGGIDDPRWQRYLKLLARGTGRSILQASSVSELWPSQLAALRAGLLADSNSKVVRMPTSAGKTRVAELAIAHTLITVPGSKAVYVAPYRALANELEEAFSNLFSDLGFRVSSILGAYQSDALEESLVEADELLILTPEKLDLLFRVEPALLEQVRLVILDEGHIVESLSRGPEFELLVTRLKRSLPEARFVFLSAVVPESTLREFAAWLGGRDEDVVSVNWRPAIQRIAKLEWSGAGGRLEFARDEGNEFFAEFLPGLVRPEVLEFVHPETHRVRTVRFPGLTNKSQIAAALALQFKDLGPVLVFCAQTNWAESVGKAMAERLQIARWRNDSSPSLLNPGVTRSLVMAGEWLGEDHVVTQLLREGVAVHHGGLPDPVKTAIESDFRSRRYQVLVATNTLAQGVNLPIRTVVVHTSRRREGERMRRISAADYWNIAGRAGRAGEETEGLVIHIVRTSTDRTDYEYYLSRRTDPEPIESALFKVLKALVDQRIDPGAVGEALDPQILALLVEEAAGDNGVGLEGLLEDSLFAIQANSHSVSSEPLNGAIEGAAAQIRQSVPEEDRLTLFSGTGLSTRSCLQLEERVARNEMAFQALFADPLPDLGKRLALLLDPLMEIEEMQSDRAFSGRLDELLAAWVSGQPMDEIGAGFALADTRQDIARFIEDQFGYLLPWGISALLRIARRVTAQQDAEGPEGAVFLPAMVKFGVPTPEASWAMSVGVPSRLTAIRMGAAFQNEAGGGYPAFREWLSWLDPFRLESEFGLSGLVLEDTVAVMNRGQRNLLLTDLRPVDEVLPADAWVQATQPAVGSELVSRVMQGRELTVARDYGNRLDRNAVALELEGEVLAYLPRRLAQYLSPELDAGLELVAEVIAASEMAEERPDFGHPVGVRLRKPQSM